MGWHVKDLLELPSAYFYLRQAICGGLPFAEWVERYGLTDPAERVADLGCGPCDVLRYLGPDQHPDYYLGIDVSDRYLEAARRRARQGGINASFHAMDLQRLPFDAELRGTVLRLLAEHRITRVLLLGVLHHIDDNAVLSTLDLLHEAPLVRTVVTQDVLRLPQGKINNFFASRDRGKYVRDEAEYDLLVGKTAWINRDKFWTRPTLMPVRYLHYLLRR